MFKTAVLSAVIVATSFASVAAARADMDHRMERHMMHKRMEHRMMMRHRMEHRMMHRRMEHRMMRHDM